MEDLEKIADALERMGASVDRANFAAKMSDPAYVERVRSSLARGGADTRDSASFFQKYAPEATAPTHAQEPKPAPGWSEAIFPALSSTRAQQAQALRPGVPDGLDAVSGAGYDPNSQQGAVSRFAGRQWPAMRDMLTMPLRAAAGAGSAMGQTLGGANSLGDLFQGIGLRRPDVSEAFRQGMADPRGQAQEFRAYTPAILRAVANPAMYAGMAEDPTTLPVTALGATTMRPLLQGITQAGMGIGARALDQGTASLNPEDIHQAVRVSDALPALLGGLGPIGSGLKKAGNAWFRQMVKPASVKGGREAAGLQRALDADLLPQLAGWRPTVGGSGEQFLRRLGQDGAEVQPILALADATGDKVSTFAAVRRAREAVQDAMADRRLAVSVPEAKGAIDWLRDRVQIPNSREAVDLAWRGIGTPANDILPSQAHRIKSALYDAAFDVAPSAAHVPKAARVMAAKEAARELRGEIAGISPQYAAQMSYLAPLYGAEDAMTRAATIRGNRNVANPMNLINIPTAAQAIWSAGNLLSRVPQVGQRSATAAGALLDGIISARLQGSGQPDSGAAYR